jgi:hypothetical protein
MLFSLSSTLLLLSGVLITSAIFYLILFFGFRQRLSFLFFSLSCLFNAGKSLFRRDAGILRETFDLSEDAERLGAIISFEGGCFFLLAFVLYEFSTPRRNWILLAYALLAAVIFHLKFSLLPLVLLIGIGASIYGFWQQKAGAIFCCIGLLIFGLATFIEQNSNYTIGYQVGLIAFIVIMTISVAQQIAAQIRTQQEALLRSSRLENQLLKKSLQPHFLFNSLTSLQEWIEQSPPAAAHFVQELAEELRMLNHMSGQKMILLVDELEMCRAHLHIMGYRRQSQFSLITKGLEGNEQVPPAIFHTLIENGLTHGYAEKKQGRFELCKKVEGKNTRYILSNDGEIEPGAPRNGSGLRYVEARLEENYPGKWHLCSGPHEGLWRVEILLEGLAD